jgi:hypothetical protein
MYDVDRYVAPTNLDYAPYGSLWTYKADIRDILFIQMGKEEIDWHPIGYLLTAIYKDRIYDSKFKEECLKEYEKTLLKHP